MPPTPASPRPDSHDYCPTCGGPYTTSCRCMRGNRWCAQRHSWNWCRVHQKSVVGTGHGTPLDACSCPDGGASGSAPAAGPPSGKAGAASFVFEFEEGDKVVFGRRKESS